MTPTTPLYQVQANNEHSRPAIMYSYSFAQNPRWTSFFPSGPEIVRYLYDVCEKFEILDKIQLDTSVKSVRWLDYAEEWEVELDYLAPGVGDLSSRERQELEKEKGKEQVVLRTEVVRAKVVASAVGGLVEPKPALDVPGRDDFEGKIVHTARWPKDLDVRDKNVVVVGTGCSAGQVVPQLVKPELGAKHVTQLMRSPPWAVPGFPPEVQEWWQKWIPLMSTYVPGFQNGLRKLMFTMSEIEFVKIFTPNEKARENRKKHAEVLLRHLRKSVPEEYHEILTPDYEVFCKRRVVDEGWFKSLNLPNVEITTLPLTSIQSKSVTLGPGRHYPPASRTDSKVPTEERTIDADIIVLANGYETNQWLHPLDVTGRNGRSLYKTWAERGGAQGYLGTAMDGFPNFFMIFGPNTATGHSSVILASENMVNYSLKFIGPILKGEVSTVEVKESAERAWTEKVQDELRRSVFNSGGGRNWYVDQDTQWNATVYPRTQVDFSLRCMFPVWSHWDLQYTTKGVARYWSRRFTRLVGVLALLWTLVTVRRLGAARASGLVRESLVRGLGGVRSVLARGR
jgi:cation diffusion facilitator CzcD-associated flavoprotein CzcO